MVVLLFPSLPDLMEDLLLLLKETGFILKMLLDHVALSKGQKYATVLESAVQEFSLPVLIFFFFFLSIADYNYYDKRAANCWSDHLAIVKQLICGLMKAACLASYFQIAS